MSTPFKYIIPLLSDKLTSEDLTFESGFVNAYNMDINKPYLDNHIFLLYSDEVLTEKALNCGQKLKSLKELHSYRSVRIKGHPFTLYCFAITKKAIRNVKDGILSFSNKDKMRILAFWNFKDEDVNAFMLDTTVFTVNFVNCVVAEEDYQPPFNLFKDEKSEVLN